MLNVTSMENKKKKENDIADKSQHTQRGGNIGEESSAVPGAAPVLVIGTGVSMHQLCQRFRAERSSVNEQRRESLISGKREDSEQKNGN